MAEHILGNMPAGYVVMPLKDYDDLIAQIDRANQAARDALSRSAMHTLETNQKLADTMNNLCTVERECFGNRNIVVHFNEKAMYDLAMQKLVRTFSEEELAVYDIFTIDDFIIGDLTLCRRKHEPQDGLAFGAGDKAVNNCSAAAPDASK